MDTFDVIYYITVLFLPIVPYFLFYKQQTNHPFYTNRDFLYYFKYIFLARPAVRNLQRKCKKLFDAKAQKTLENPKKAELNLQLCDNQIIYGVDQKGNNLTLRFSVDNLVASVWLCLRLEKQNVIYTFPRQQTKVCSIASWLWKTKDLQIDVLEPFRRLRVSFNGLLENTENSEIEHLQFSFIWTAAGKPLFYPLDAAASSLADALARHPWKDGDWLKLIGDEKGYEQFGSLRGFVRGDSFQDDFVMNLASCRRRFWSAKQVTVDRSVRLFVAAEDGCLLHLWLHKLKNGCRELQSGSVITNFGRVYPIQNSDVRLEFLGENKHIPESFLINVQAAGRIYRVALHLCQHKVSKTPQLRNIPADCDINVQQAKALVEFWYNDSTSQVPHPSPILVENKTTNIPNDVLVTHFSDKMAQLVHLTGGKGCSLAMLTSIKSDFIVPDGFILTVNAFKRQLDVNYQMKKAVAILDDICCGRCKGDLEDACLQTVKTFQTEEMLPEIRAAILSALAKVKTIANTTIASWAVRSSAIGEDSEQLSSAGQNETFLGCTKPAEVLQSVMQCWASLFTFQSVRYRHQHGLPVFTQMAVVVQRMIPAECAGVLFTRHPTTLNPAHLLITANHGLGESVVSGRSEPDTVILQRTVNNHLSIKEKTLGSKSMMIMMVNEGVEEVEGIDGFSLSEAQALHLGHVGILLEERFGSGRDIEWAFFQQQLYLLQSRPITAVNAFTLDELERELDDAILTPENVYTIANTGEVLPGAVSALTSSTIVRGLDLAYQNTIKYNDLDPYACTSLRTFNHHIFIDVINGIHRRGLPKDSLDLKVVDLSIFGHPVHNDTIHNITMKRYGTPTKLQTFKEFLTAVYYAWNSQSYANLTTKLSRTAVGIDRERDTLQDMYQKIEKSLDTFQELSYYHCLTTRTSIFYQFFAMVVLAENCKDFTVDHYNDIALILGSCEDVVSAQIPSTLANITKLLHQNNDFLKIEPEDGQKWLKENHKEASELFESFVKKHGHRAVREFDLVTKPWRLNPADVIKMIQTNCKTNKVKEQKVNKTVDEVINELVSPQKNSTRKTLRFIVQKCRKAVGLREQSKSELIRFVDVLREAYLYLAEKMSLKGLVPDQDLIFHFTHYEIGQILAGCETSPALITKAMKRRKLIPKWDDLKYPEMSYGLPKPENEFVLPKTGGTLKCTGTPVCTGIVRARACVITDLTEIEQLHEGDVLITHCTDIGWSPYFPMISGIVTELGGLVSHGAVIAREYGIPCIVGAQRATKLFSTGDMVILSGKTGTIELV